MIFYKYKSYFALFFVAVLVFYGCSDNSIGPEKNKEKQTYQLKASVKPSGSGKVVENKLKDYANNSVNVHSVQLVPPTIPATLMRMPVLVELLEK